MSEYIIICGEEVICGFDDYIEAKFRKLELLKKYPNHRQMDIYQKYNDKHNKDM